MASFSSGDPLSVVMTTCFLYCLSCFLRKSWNMWKFAIVSVVVPDFVMTLTSTRPFFAAGFIVSRMLLMLSVSTVSA